MSAKGVKKQQFDEAKVRKSIGYMSVIVLVCVIGIIGYRFSQAVKLSQVEAESFSENLLDEIDNKNWEYLNEKLLPYPGYERLVYHPRHLVVCIAQWSWGVM